MAAPTYRERLMTEGFVLMGSGLAGSAALLVLAKGARRWPLNTAGQLALVVFLLARFGPRSLRTAMARAVEVEPGQVGSGEPTPLWHVPAVVVGLALAFKLAESLPGGDLAGWDASLRITGGSALAGAAQVFLLEPRVGREEQSSGRTFYRVAGSRIARGTKLGFTRARQPTLAP